MSCGTILWQDGAQTLSIDGFDEAYYAEFIKPNTRLPNEPDEVHQFLILRRGGEVLYFRTEAPDSLREHLDEFADIFQSVQRISIKRSAFLTGTHFFFAILSLL